MEDFRVTQTGDEIQGIFNQSPIDTSDIAGLKEADALLDSRLESVEGKIPAGASTENPLTDKQYVDNAVATSSATFRGTYNEVTDLELTTEATHAEIAAALADVIDTADNNDYCFVQIPTSDATPTEISCIERYKFVTGTGWEYEYTLNSSGFTSDQWAAINSGITSALVTKLTDLPTNSELTILLNGKANAADVYTKSETYNKTELDNMITTPDVQYATVTATAQTTSVTDLLPATGSADTIYRIGSWDGTQYNASSYSEYSWDGSAYMLLDVKNTGIDAVPIVGSHNLVESGGVADKCQVYDNLITPVLSVNLFDKTKAVRSRYVSRTTGKLVSSSASSYFTTDFIPITSAGAYADLAKNGGTYFGYACYSAAREPTSEDNTFTHGMNSRYATFQEGDAYVRFSGNITDIDMFMVVAGTSSDYPSTYYPYGYIGEMKSNTIGNGQLTEGCVTANKIAAEAVNASKLSDMHIWKDGDSATYAGTVKEIFFFDVAFEGVTDISIRFYDGFVFKGLSSGGYQWRCIPVSTKYTENNIAYPIACSESNNEHISVGDIIGYIVFSDISTFKSTSSGAENHTTQISLARAKFLLNNPIISTQTYNIKDGDVSTAKIANKAVSFEKIGFTTIEPISKNLLNTEDTDYKHAEGYYINYSTGNTGYSSTSHSCWGYTGFIPVSSQGLYFNAYIKAGVFAGAVYNKEKRWVRDLRSAQYTYQEGDAYVRWTLAENPISPYEEGQYMVWEGDSSVQPEYDEYEAKEVIDPAVLPSSEATVQDGSITEAKLSQEVKNSIVGTGVELCIPDVIPCVVGDTLRIYFRSIVKAPNPYIWDLVAVSSVGKSYPRYYEYKPTAAGNKTVTFYVRNSARSIVAQKAVTIKCITAMSSPASNKNILMVGASMLADGNVTSELNRRLTSDTGDGTPLNPTGLGLNNITFVGRRTAQDIHQEGNSGWSWKDYATIGRYAYRFFVVGQVGIDVQPGAVYSGAGTLKFTVSESDIDIDRATGTGYFTCTYTGSGTQPASGTLTLYSGEGDATITYDSFNLDSGNPFWNDSTSQLDFISYANNYCNGSIDVLVSFTAMNDFTAAGNENGIAARIENYVKPFIRAFHEQFPDSIVVLCTMYLGSVSGGMAVSYGASGTWNYYNVARMTWKWSELVRELAADDEFSSYVRIIDTNSELDCENLYPTGTRTVANRSEVTEVIQNNGVHTTVAGKKTIADSMYEGLNDIMS